MYVISDENNAVVFPVQNIIFQYPNLNPVRQLSIRPGRRPRLPDEPPLT